MSKVTKMCICTQHFIIIDSTLIRSHVTHVPPSMAHSTHRFIHKWNEPYLPLLTSNRASLSFECIHFPCHYRRLNWPRCLDSDTGVVRLLETVTHPVTDRTQRRVTLLICLQQHYHYAMPPFSPHKTSYNTFLAIRRVVM